MFRHPSRGRSSAACGRMSPYATTTSTSGAHCASSARPSAVFNVGGCAIGSRCSVASSLTGDARNCCPRPAGRSGCVSTPTTWCRDFSSAWRAGNANCGVPAKAIRSDVMRAPGGLGESSSIRSSGRGLAGLAGAFLAILVALLADALALQVGEIVDAELSIEVIHLVLVAYGPQAIEIDFEELALHILRTGPDVGRPFHLIEYAGHGQATFLGDPGAFAGQDFGVAEHLRPGLSLGNIHDDQSLMDVNLGGRETHAGRLVHGLEHVLGKLRQGRVEDIDRLGLGAKSRVRIFKNLQARHDVPLDC